MRISERVRMEKKLLIRALALLLAVFVPLTALAEVTPLAFRRDDTNRNGLVRVRLSSLGTPRTLTLNLKAAYSANGGEISLASGTQVEITCNASTGSMTLKNANKSWNMGKYFTLNRSSSGATATISQAENGNPYPADFSIRSVQSNGSYGIQIVASIQMEDYLYGVLPYEMGNSAPLEALKAQAVAARTYTVRMMEKRSSQQYDVVDTNADQVYRGTPSGNGNCQSAVEATRGIVLKFGNSYAETYYSSSNGGQTESALNIWGGKGYDYLTVKDDPYDAISGSAKTKTATIYKDLSHGSNRQALITLLEEKAITKLKQQGYSATKANTTLIRLDSLKLHTPKYPSPSKLYTKADFGMTVETAASGGSMSTVSVTVTADVFGDLESILGMSLQSASNEIWTVKDNQSSYTLKAGRYGHGVGLSQYGAMEMARQGYTYDYILGFYYPGCTNVQLNLSTGTSPETGSGSESQLPGNEEENTGSTMPSLPQTALGYATVIANGYLNLRQSPSLSAPILTIALEGETIAVLAVENGWATVEYNGIRAYALRSLLSELFQQGGGEESQPSVEQPAGQSARIYSMNGSVNFRETPSLNGRILMQLVHDTEVVATGQSGGFTAVHYQGIDGYVMTSFLVFAEVDIPQPPATEDVPSVEELLPSSPSTENGAFRKATVTTVRGSLNMREAPSDTARVVLQIPQYASVEAAVLDSVWCRIRYGGKEGYSMHSFLTFDTQQDQSVMEETESVLPEQAIGTAKVSTSGGSLNLRLSPERHSNVIRTISEGETVKVYSWGPEWAMVEYQGQVGYAMTAYLAMQDENSTPAASSQVGEAVSEEGGVHLVPVTESEAGESTPAAYGEQQTAENEQSSSETHGFMQAMPEAAVEAPPLPPLPVDMPADFKVVSGITAEVTAEETIPLIYPSESEEALCAIPKGEILPVLAHSEKWCVIVWEETTGYVPLEDVALIEN